MKFKYILLGISIGIIALPTAIFGSSLITGKSVDEAIQILATQFDNLVGRVEMVETNQFNQDQTLQELQEIINQQKILIETNQTEQEEVVSNQEQETSDIQDQLSMESILQTSKEDACRILPTIDVQNDPMKYFIYEELCGQP